MNLGFLDNAQGVTPLLVHLYDTHKLYALAQDKKPAAKAELTEAVAALLGTDLSPRESELVADVLISLMKQAELDLRCALAERLSLAEDVPLRLILQMANDEICVAEPVLRQSPVLADLDLSYIVKSKGADYWQAIAKRHDLSNELMEMLVDTGDFDTAAALVDNMNVTLTAHSVAVLSEMAQGHENIAVPLLHRDVVSGAVASSLYQYVGQALKKYILDNYDVDRALLIDSIDEVIEDFEESAQAHDFMPTKPMMNAAARFHEKGLLTIKLMVGVLKRGQLKNFISQFSLFLNLENDTVIEILNQPSGQGLAVACKAFGVVKSDFISIYLLTNRMRSTERMVDMKDMNRAIKYFESVRPEVARGIMGHNSDKS